MTSKARLIDHLKNFINFKFWTDFSTYFFNSTYTRVDLYVSIYGTYKGGQRLTGGANVDRVGDECPWQG